ncbi:MAG TPA: DUF1080 domain-containing protein, partial [Saprospiraceae bacterium]|nr:DUF1080 domain-containing protein [Saprospiraceae bacterium]
MRQTLLLFFIAFTTLVQSQEWIYLFNGKNLDGWNKKGGEAVYSIEKGVLVGKTVANTPNTFLC